MKDRIAVLLWAGVLLSGGARVQAQSCGLRPIEMKPIGQLGCSDMEQVCDCNAQGRCGWVWKCAAAPGYQPGFALSPPPSSINDAIVYGVKPPQVEPLGDAFARMRAQQAALEAQRQATEETKQRTRALELENQQREMALQEKRLLREKEKRAADSPPAAASPQVAPVNPERLRTHGLINGEAWSAFPSDVKLAYLWAATDTVTYEARSRLTDYENASLTVTAFAKGMDLFYAFPANRSIPVLQMMNVVVLWSQDVPQADVDALLEIFRKVAAESPERMK